MIILNLAYYTVLWNFTKIHLLFIIHNMEFYFKLSDFQDFSVDILIITVIIKIMLIHIKEDYS